jgi:hypothetical protein
VLSVHTTAESLRRQSSLDSIKEGCHTRLNGGDKPSPRALLMRKAGNIHQVRLRALDGGTLRRPRPNSPDEFLPPANFFSLQVNVVVESFRR